uniref:2'-deoxynucleoside 5'-phosphate N-hydrolase 1-like n=1 Tax=Styela clava TaxID=7725 RepID=UPI00193A44D5|nr:2'-deoxynucleoside 5'-phosphate N-hydrolase 1-like [Styela clava]
MGLKIYFCGSISGGRGDAELYCQIVEHMKTYGTVLTEHVASLKQTADGRVGPDGNLSATEIHDRDIEWLTDSDVVVAEVTTPSLGVGYEIGRALDMGKNILCLFRDDAGRRLSAMIDGAQSSNNNISVKRYIAISDALEYVSGFLKKSQNKNAAV